jgi:hypothetical protein
MDIQVGAQVMMVQNNPDLDYVNGTRGVVVGYEKPSDAEKVRPHLARS